MNRALINKCLRESRWLLLGCFVTIFSFCWLRVWMVSRLDTGRFKAILDLLPADWKKFSSVDMEWLITYAGRISLAYDEPIVVLTMSIWAITRGSDCVSGELNRGTMEMLLAQPVSRLQVLWTQGIVTMVGVVALASAAWLGTFAGIQTTQARQEVQPVWTLPFSLPVVGDEIPLPWKKSETRFTPMKQKVDAAVFLPATVNLLSLGIFWAGLTTLVSACDRFRWRTIGIVVASYIVQMALKILGTAAPEWIWLRRMSVFSAYEPEAFVHIATESPANTWSFWLEKPIGTITFFGPMGYDFLLLGLGYLAYVLAAIIFHRRDLPAPL